MKVTGAELRRLSMPLVTPFRTSIGTERQRDVLLVRLRTDGPDGWGECVALNEPSYTGEYAAGAHHVVREFLLPRLFAEPDVTAATVAPLLAGVQEHRMAKAAVEMAVLDAELRAAGVSLAACLGGVRDRVEAGASVGIADSIDQLLRTVDRHLANGYRRVKLKIEPGWDIEPVTAVRRHVGDGVPLQVDGNGAYRGDDIDHLARLDEADLVLVEQPLPADDLLGHARLAARLRTPVCLDESITSAAGAAAAIELAACSVVNVKAGRVGGYLEAKRVHDVCADRGVAVWCGGMLETGLGRAANLALASLPGFTLPGDLSPPGDYLRTDICPPLALADGCLRVPDGPGLGVAVYLDVVARCTTTVEEVAP